MHSAKLHTREKRQRPQRTYCLKHLYKANIDKAQYENFLRLKRKHPTSSIVNRLSSYYNSTYFDSIKGVRKQTATSPRIVAPSESFICNIKRYLHKKTPTLFEPFHDESDDIRHEAEILFGRISLLDKRLSNNSKLLSHLGKALIWCFIDSSMYRSQEKTPQIFKYFYSEVFIMSLFDKIRSSQYGTTSIDYLVKNFMEGLRRGLRHKYTLPEFKGKRHSDLCADLAVSNYKLAACAKLLIKYAFDNDDIYEAQQLLDLTEKRFDRSIDIVVLHMFDKYQQIIPKVKNSNFHFYVIGLRTGLNVP